MAVTREASGSIRESDPPGHANSTLLNLAQVPFLNARILSPARGGRQTAAAAEVTTKTSTEQNFGNASNADRGTAAAPIATRRPPSRCGIGRRTAGHVGKYHVNQARRGDM